MQVGNETQYSDEYSQRNGQRKADDGKANAIENAHAYGNDELSAEVCVHALLEVFEKRVGKGVVAMWNKFAPPLGDSVIVIENEKEVKDGDAP